MKELQPNELEGLVEYISRVIKKQEIPDELIGRVRGFIPTINDLIEGNLRNVNENDLDLLNQILGDMEVSPTQWDKIIGKVSNAVGAFDDFGDVDNDREQIRYSRGSSASGGLESLGEGGRIPTPLSSVGGEVVGEGWSPLQGSPVIGARRLTTGSFTSEDSYAPAEQDEKEQWKKIILEAIQRPMAAQQRPMTAQEFVGKLQSEGLIDDDLELEDDVLKGLEKDLELLFNKILSPVAVKLNLGRIFDAVFPTDNKSFENRLKWEPEILSEIQKQSAVQAVAGGQSSSSMVRTPVRVDANNIKNFLMKLRQGNVSNNVQLRNLLVTNNITVSGDIESYMLDFANKELAAHDILVALNKILTLAITNEASRKQIYSEISTEIEKETKTKLMMSEGKFVELMKLLRNSDVSDTYTLRDWMEKNGLKITPDDFKKVRVDMLACANKNLTEENRLYALKNILDVLITNEAVRLSLYNQIGAEIKAEMAGVVRKFEDSDLQRIKKVLIDLGSGKYKGKESEALLDLGFKDPNKVKNINALIIEHSSSEKDVKLALEELLVYVNPKDRAKLVNEVLNSIRPTFGNKEREQTQQEEFRQQEILVARQNSGELISRNKAKVANPAKITEAFVRLVRGDCQVGYFRMLLRDAGADLIGVDQKIKEDPNWIKVKSDMSAFTSASLSAASRSQALKNVLGVVSSVAKLSVSETQGIQKDIEIACGIDSGVVRGNHTSNDDRIRELLERSKGATPNNNNSFVNQYSKDNKTLVNKLLDWETKLATRTPDVARNALKGIITEAELGFNEHKVEGIMGLAVELRGAAQKARNLSPIAVGKQAAGNSPLDKARNAFYGAFGIDKAPDLKRGSVEL